MAISDGNLVICFLVLEIPQSFILANLILGGGVEIERRNVYPVNPYCCGELDDDTVILEFWSGCGFRF